MIIWYGLLEFQTKYSIRPRNIVFASANCSVSRLLQMLKIEMEDFLATSCNES